MNTEYKLVKELAHQGKTKPDFNNLPFGKYFTDHMFAMDYFEGEGWQNPRILPYDQFLIGPAAMVFHYGQAVFEGLKAYKAEDGRTLLFRPSMNFKRLNQSNDRMCIPRIDEEYALYALKELLKVDADWIPDAENTSIYIRPFIIATEESLGVHSAYSYRFMIIMSPVGPYYKNGFAPIKIMVEDEYVRAVKGGVGFTKSSANYAISLKGQEKAHKEGYEQVLWLDGVERKYVEEVGSMNVFFCIDGKVVTPELNGSILPGITRSSVIQLLKSWGVAVEERKLAIEEVFEAHEKGILTEAFGSGTAAVISAIGDLRMGDRRIILSDGKIGDLTQKIYDTMTGMQYGRVKDEFGWVETVE